MRRTSYLLIITLLALNCAQLEAQEVDPPDDPFRPQGRINQRSMGDQSFAIALGTIFPLFTVLLSDIPDIGKSSGVHPTQLTVLGGVGSLTYSVYASPNMKIGLQLAGSFKWDINENPLYMIPITVKGSWEFRPFQRLTIPIHLAMGINMTSWNEEFIADFIIKPGFGAYFNWSPEWSFGGDVSYWFIPQLNARDKRYNSLGNFIDVNLVAEHHF